MTDILDRARRTFQLVDLESRHHGQSRAWLEAVTAARVLVSKIELARELDEEQPRAS